MTDRKIDINSANIAQPSSGDGTTYNSIIVGSPEDAAKLKKALAEGSPVKSSDIKRFVHNLPFAQNPTFTGRENILEQIDKSLGQAKAVAVTQPQAIHGLGGIGKTQIALEYAYRHLDDYKCIFWIAAENQSVLQKSFGEIASILRLPEREVKEFEVLIKGVRSWLETNSD